MTQPIQKCKGNWDAVRFRQGNESQNVPQHWMNIMLISYAVQHAEYSIDKRRTQKRGRFWTKGIYSEGVYPKGSNLQYARFKKHPGHWKGTPHLEDQRYICLIWIWRACKNCNYTETKKNSADALDLYYVHSNHLDLAKVGIIRDSNDSTSNSKIEATIELIGVWHNPFDRIEQPSQIINWRITKQLLMI